MEKEELITKHKDILEFRERPYNEKAYIEEFLKLAEKKVKNLNIPAIITCCLCGNNFNQREQLPKMCICKNCSRKLGGY